MTTPAAVWTPPRLKQAPDHDALWNALVSHVGAPVPLAGRIVALVALGEAPAAEATAMRLCMASGLGFVAVPVVFPFGALCGADLVVPDLAILPPVLRDVLLEAMVAVMGSALPQTPHGPMAVERAGPWADVEAEQPDAAALRWFRVALQGLAPEPIVVDLGATLPTLAAAFGAPAPRRVWTGLKTRLTRQAHVTLGRLHRSVAELRALSVGSVIVMEGGFDPGTATVRSDDTLYRFGRAGGGWVCLAVETCDPAAGNNPMADTTEHAPQAAGPGSARLDVRLDLDVGTLVVPLAEIETWQPGSVVALQPVPAAQGVEVTLRSNGQAIGTGDLVTIDDRIAVRISSLLFDP